MVSQKLIERTLYLGFFAFLIFGALYTAYCAISWPLVYHLNWIALVAIYFLVAPFQELVKEGYWFIYKKLVYENRIFWELFYDVVCWMVPSKAFNQINYGFAPLTKTGKLMELEPAYEGERMSLQLYYRTVTGFGLLKDADLEGKTILEVSSGRAGGIDWIANTFKPKRVIGLDISQNNIDWCNKTYSKVKNMEFVLGNAETFVDEGVIEENSIDIIISVDSAHLYPHFNLFIEQCRKALKPQGNYFMSDFMQTDKLKASELCLQSCGMTQIKKETTTENIMHAMDIDGERRLQLVLEQSPRIFRPFFRWNSGAKGSRIYELLRTGQFSGHAWAFKKH